LKGDFLKAIRDHESDEAPVIGPAPLQTTHTAMFCIFEPAKGNQTVRPGSADVGFLRDQLQ
jgi:hypothetical protein